MNPRDFLRKYTEVFLDQKPGLSSQGSSGVFQYLPLLSKNHYYKDTNYSEAYIDTLSRSELLNFIQELPIIEKNQRIIPREVIADINRLQEEAVQRLEEIDRLKNELGRHQKEIVQLKDQLEVNSKERQSEKKYMQNEISGLYSTITELQSSTSWRLTAPLRFLSMMMKKLKRLS